MIYMGIDASTTSTGLGIFNNQELIYYECIKPSKKLEWEDRIGEIAKRLNEILIEFNNIEKVYVEDVPLKDGKPTLVKLACVRGAIKSICALHNIELNPQKINEWREHANFYDGTTKGLKRDEMKQKAIIEVKNLFNIDVNDDVAEGILVGYRTVYPKSHKGFNKKNK